ncbi:acyl-CoA dehydrogenase family protein [Mycobacterium colombiense]|uniref:acyl-CoA dehydrogenase family protein n=1 Tax=Mycobacterium colombiense TaxID=339268 RepID=UPI0009D761BB|nr:acyl-CoA dehydrogenase family protein [Mycobacterium colombiense]
MDFTFTEEQETVGKVARQLFEHRATPEHLTELEAGDVRYDAGLWAELASADLLGIALPESVGGSGGGFLELGVLLSEVGFSVAPVPVYPTLVLGADTLARHGDSVLQRRYLPGVVDGSTILTTALVERGNSDPATPRTTARSDGDTWRLDGSKELVPAAQLAAAIVVSAQTEDGPGLFIVDTGTDGVSITPVPTTNGEPHADVDLTGVIGRRLTEHDAGNIVGSLYTRALVGLCALQIGVVERALKLAAKYTSEREQFGRPIGSFQAVQQRLADAFIDVEAIRWTTWHAAWLIAQGRPADREAGIAKFWAAEAGARVASSAQQVHGGMGIDITYPLSRYFLWAKQNELALGSASQQLARLGNAYRKEAANDLHHQAHHDLGVEHRQCR